MRLFTFLSLILLLTACSQEPGEPVTGVVSPSGKLQENSEASKRANSSRALVVRMGEATVAKGQIACLPVAAQDFSNLIGFQFTVQWDSTQLDFQRVKNFGLPGYGAANFGDRFASSGYLSTLWTEASLQGGEVPNGTVLFEACFKNIASSGTESTVRFTDGPTTFEIIAADMSQLKFRYSNGRVISK
jgi:hypothetical protein